MINLKYKNFFFLQREVWFSNKTSFLNAFKLVSYIQVSKLIFRYLYYSNPFYTKVIYLNNELDKLLNKVDKAALYEIRRAEKDGLIFFDAIDKKSFFNSYSDFCARRGLPVSEKVFKSREPVVRIFTARNGDEDLVMHAYIVDEESRRIRQLHSINFLNSDTPPSIRQKVGRANRWLIWEVICHFKSQNYLLFDLGGYAMDTNDPVLLGINSFKDEFGGDLIMEWNLISWPLLFLQTVKKLLV